MRLELFVDQNGNVVRVGDTVEMKVFSALGPFTGYAKEMQGGKLMLVNTMDDESPEMMFRMVNPMRYVLKEKG